MAERYLISKDNLAEGTKVPEIQKLKIERNAALAEEKRKASDEKKKLRATQRHDLKMRTLKYDKEYSQHTKKLIALRRQAKGAGNFFVEPEPKLLFVMRIVGIIKMAPKPRKVMQLLRLRQLHNGVFLKVLFFLIIMVFIGPYGDNLRGNMPHGSMLHGSMLYC